MSQISLKNHPELVLLLEESETLASFMKLAPEFILLRWVNYHLAKAGSSKRITNFSSDVTDSEIYSILTNQLDRSLCPLAKMTDINGNNWLMHMNTIFIFDMCVCLLNKNKIKTMYISMDIYIYEYLLIIYTYSSCWPCNPQRATPWRWNIHPSSWHHRWKQETKSLLRGYDLQCMSRSLSRRIQQHSLDSHRCPTGRGRGRHSRRKNIPYVDKFVEYWECVCQ